MSTTTPHLTCTGNVAAPRFTTRTQIVALSCACAGATAFLFAVDPSRHAVYPQCMFHNATGLYCAGCGATRALYALLHGRVLTALHDNVLFVALLPVFLYIAGSHLLRAWRQDAWPPLRLNSKLLFWRGFGFFLIIAAFTVVRNLPGHPFDWLRPIG